MLRIALILASIANLAAGLGLGGLWSRFRHDPGMPIVMLFATLITMQATLGLIFPGRNKEFGVATMRSASRPSTSARTGEC